MIKVEFCFDSVEELNQFLAKIDGCDTTEVEHKNEDLETPSVSIEEITTLAVKLIDGDKDNQPKLVSLLDEFGVRAVTEIEPYQYYAFLKGLRKIEAGV